MPRNINFHLLAIVEYVIQRCVLLLIKVVATMVSTGLDRSTSVHSLNSYDEFDLGAVNENSVVASTTVVSEPLLPDCHCCVR